MTYFDFRCGGGRLGAALGVLILSSFATASAADQLLDNPGFESGSLASWDTLGTAAGVTDVAANVHTGKYALGVKVPGGAGAATASKNLELGKDYDLSFYGKADDGSIARVTVAVGDQQVIPTMVVSGSTYKQYSASFTSHANAPAKIQFWKDGGMGNGLAYVDDFSLTEKAPQDFGGFYPGNASVINVKSYGAIGDGIHDDTAALQKAISRGTDIFLPPGKYLITSSLEAKTAEGKWRAYVILRGAGRDATSIVLKDNTFTDAKAAKAMIKTASQEDWGDGTGNEAFYNFVTDLTVNTGNGNPGAIGIDYLANNSGAIRNVAVVSGDGAGAAGIAMVRHYPGPCLLKNVSIRGFDYGMTIGTQDYSITLEHITLSGQKVAGIHNQDNVVSIHDLQSMNSVPAMISEGSLALVTWVGGKLQGGDPGQVAIHNTGSMYLRDIEASGYKNALDADPGNKIDFYCSSKPNTFGSATKPLMLPIKETPEAIKEPIDDWADVGLPNGGDDTAAIQAAFKSGKHTIYFRNGGYRVADTIIVPDSVQRIIGFGARILPVGPKYADAKSPCTVFRFVATSNDVVVERLLWGNWDYTAPGAVYIENQSTKALALIDCTVEGAQHHSYENTATGTGPLFVENLYTDIGSTVRPVPGWLLNHEDVWMRQFDDEIGNQRVANEGGSLWILGVKSERQDPIVVTTGGGRTEVLGGLLLPIFDPAAPAFVSKDSSMSLTFATTSYKTPVSDYKIDVSAKNGDKEYSLTRADMEKQGFVSGTRTIVPLFIGSPDAP